VVLYCDRTIPEAASASVNLVYGNSLKFEEVFRDDRRSLHPLRGRVQNETSLNHAIARLQARLFPFVSVDRSFRNNGRNLDHF
jgi:hypothetical protein